MTQDFSQLDRNGRLRHLITLDGLDAGLMRELLERAQDYLCLPGQLPPRGGDLRGWTVANLFAEPSTRTRASFELAALRLGADALNLDVMLSSRVKGESILDTIYTLQAMQVDVFVIRDAEPGIIEFVARHVEDHVSVISGGEAHLSHPTQGLLDALTIQQSKGGFRDLVVTIVGDIRHSRVARSAHCALSGLGVAELRLVAPEEMMPDKGEFAGAVRYQSFDAALERADVVMMLRIQRERIAEIATTNLKSYHEQYGLTAARLTRARPEAIVMHPGPMNRGVEISSEVADGPQSVIRRQVSNGVAIRMAVLAHLAEARGRRIP
ncbi:MAG TPA: aspartate carbamoyltransferase catalytic subunit [Steroidobacteraceae bacterium]|nr:aspartate carbamoyltransferase catalytic subunit [Steroidobacteraceae bacterium]